MDLEEKTIKHNTIYNGKKISFYVDEVMLPNKKETTKEGIFRARNSVILALTKDNKIIVEGQFRHPFKKEIIALPAGKAENGETFLETAKREFKEEVGMIADTWIDLGLIYPAPAYSNEEVRLFLAKDLHDDVISRDEDEFLNIYYMSKQEFLDSCFNGKIFDARTIIAAYKFEGIDNDN